MPTPSTNGAASSADVFVRTFNEVRAELVSTLSFVLGNQDDAYDAAQNAFLKCWRNQSTLSDVHNMRAWIFRVGLNAAKDLQRNAWRRRSKPLAAGMDASYECSPTEKLEEKEDMDRLRTAVAELRDEEQAVFLLRQNGNFTYEEIADIRRSPVGTVKTQMRSALHKLRKLLQEQKP